MTDTRLSRLGPLAGVLFVVLEFAGIAIQSAGNAGVATLGDSSGKVLREYADPVTTGYWVGSYLELLSLVAFGVFAVWLFRRRRGPGLLAAGVYVAVVVVSLVVGHVLEYRVGHGISSQEILTLFDIQAGLFVVSWGVAGMVLLLAPVTGWLRRSAIVLGVLGIVAMAAPKAGMAQIAATLFYLWVAAAGITCAIRPRALPMTEAPARA